MCHCAQFDGCCYWTKQSHFYYHNRIMLAFLFLKRSSLWRNVSEMISSRSMALGSFVSITPFTNPFTLNGQLSQTRDGTWMALTGSEMPLISRLILWIQFGLVLRTRYSWRIFWYQHALTPLSCLHCRLIAHYSAVLSSICSWKNEKRCGWWAG